MSKSWEPTNLGGSLGKNVWNKCVSTFWLFPCNEKNIYILDFIGKHVFISYTIVKYFNHLPHFLKKIITSFYFDKILYTYNEFTMFALRVVQRTFISPFSYFKLFHFYSLMRFVYYFC